MTWQIYVGVAITMFLVGAVVLAAIHKRCDANSLLSGREDLYFACFMWLVVSVSWIIAIPSVIVCAVIALGGKFLVDLICKLV